MRVKTPPIAAAFVLLVAVNVQAQASLDAARELYASAEYESALAMLDGLRASEWPREEQHAIELYRALCMVATGKEADAKNVIEGLVTRDPLYRPSNDLPPRVRVELRTADRGEELLGGVGRERAQADGCCVQHAAAPARPALEQLGSTDAQEHDRRVVGSVGDVLDQVEECRMGPVKILQHDYDRSLSRKRFEQLSKGPESLLACPSFAAEPKRLGDALSNECGLLITGERRRYRRDGSDPRRAGLSAAATRSGSRSPRSHRASGR